jgi:hypothetical protein
MDSITSGSQEHLESFTNTKLKTFYENLWDQEITVLIAQDALRQKKAKLIQIEERLERKEYPSANEGKKEKSAVEDDINALNNLILRDTEQIANYRSIIEKTHQWSKENKPSDK